ncbi:NAD(P)-dependent oxidoreductase [Ihubacter sp. rT4E-8]|uniref:NAD(P)-dependent oxidoreductase n=1 Tax=Ihubacter sp. rT4E-8 TaxID=3242369 RepID=UPI003CF80F21
MKRFKKLVLVDDCGIMEFVKPQLEEAAEEVVSYEDFPKDPDVIADRIKDADAIMVSWNTQISGAALAKAPNLRYIGLCCTYFNEHACNVDIPYCRAHDITVTGVRDYGDNGVAEFVISDLVRMVKGLGDIAFYDEQRELGGMKLGVIGLGTLGGLIADAAAFFGMDVAYYNRHQKENCPYQYMEKEELLERSDVILTAITRNQIVMSDEEFSKMGTHKIFINVGVGPSFDQTAFEKWIGSDGYAILDFGAVHKDKLEWYQQQKNVSISPRVTGFTYNARKRLGEKAVENIREYLK